MRVSSSRVSERRILRTVIKLARDWSVATLLVSKSILSAKPSWNDNGAAYPDEAVTDWSGQTGPAQKVPDLGFLEIHVFPRMNPSCVGQQQSIHYYIRTLTGIHVYG